MSAPSIISSTSKAATMAIDIITRIHSAFGFEPLQCPKEGNQFDDLVQALKAALGPSSGLDSADVDVEYLTALMRDYLSSEKDWSRFAFGNASKGYTRNLVDDGNGKSNLVCRHFLCRPRRRCIVPVP
jgi:cysteine dioxygenase